MGRSFNLIAAAFLYMLYSNCLNIVQSLIAQGKLDFWVGLLVPHALAIALVVLLFAAHQLSLAGLFSAGRSAQRPPERRMRTLTRYIGRDVLARDAADLRRAAQPVRVLRPDQRAARRRQGQLHDRRRRCSYVALHLPSRVVRAVSGRRR